MLNPDTGLLGLSKAEIFFAVEPGFGVSQQTQASLSASLETMQELK
jgi:hypothetical protein